MTIITRDEEGDQERYIIKCSKRREGGLGKKGAEGVGSSEFDKDGSGRTIF